MKKIILSLMMMVSVVMAQAQQTTVEGSKLFDNTTVGIYGGASGWINPGVVNEEKFLQGVKPVAGISLGKWFTPVVGGEIFYDAFVGNLPFNADVERWTLVDYANLGANLQLNVNNMFGYKGYPNRVEAVPFFGLGWGHGFTKTSATNFTDAEYVLDNGAANFMTSDAGIRVDFNMGKQRAWQINVRPSMTWIIAGEQLPVQYNDRRAYTSLQVGVTYKLGHKNSKGERTHNFTSAYTAAEYIVLQDTYNALKEAYDQKPKEVEKVVEKEVIKEVVVEKVETIKTPVTPHFVQGLAIVDATSVSALDDLAEEMKSTDFNYTITGYASLEGSEKYNEHLSLKRANAIKQCLVDRGVSTDRLETVAGGATDKFGDTYEQNRVVVINH